MIYFLLNNKKRGNKTCCSLATSFLNFQLSIFNFGKADCLGIANHSGIMVTSTWLPLFRRTFWRNWLTFWAFMLSTTFL